MLKAKWATSLSGTGSDVSPLLNKAGVYVGSNGYVKRLDPDDGDVEATNPLSGRGHNEVCLAAPLDSSLLVVGTNGYVLGLDPQSLETKWQTSLPGCGYGIVNVLCTKRAIYAGCNGYVYCLIYHDGLVAESNGLSGYGSHETRLSLVSGVDGRDAMLLVSINGYTLGLSCEKLLLLWYNDMPGSGHSTTSVIGGQNLAFGACGGRVYQMVWSTGQTLNTNELSGTGSHEVRMMLDSRKSHLYVGTNGYGNCLRVNDLSTIYSVSLPGSGYSITDVAKGDNATYFANNGYVFQLNDSGTVVAQNDLPGQGTYLTQLSTSSNRAVLLIVGINGSVLGLNISSNPKDLLETPLKSKL